MFRDSELIQAREQVQHIEEKQVLHEVDKRIGNKRDDLGLSGRQSIVVQAGLPLRSCLKGLHEQGQWRSQDEQERDRHRQNHVHQHVHGVHRRHVQA